MSLEKPILSKSSNQEQYKAKVEKMAHALMQPHPNVKQISEGIYVKEKKTGLANMNKVCAVGLLMYHHGYKDTFWDDIVDFHCGIDGCTYRSGTEVSLYGYIMHLNDYHRLTFYQVGEELLKLIN